MSGRYSLTVWMAFADFFGALALLIFAVYIASRPPAAKDDGHVEELIRIDKEVKTLAAEIGEELRKRGIDVPVPDDNVAIVLPELLLFESGRYEVRDPQKALQVAAALRAVQDRWRRNFVLVIQGHTDARPPRPNHEYSDNLELSRLRARAVEHYLTRMGVAPPRFQVVSQGVGPAHPVVPNCRSRSDAIDCAGPADFRSAEALAPNRRIELRFGVFSGNTR